MKKTPLFLALLCAAAVTGCGTSSNTENSISIEVKTTSAPAAETTASAASSSAAASSVTSETTAASSAAAQQSETASETAAVTTTETVSSAAATESETEAPQTTAETTESAAQTTEAATTAAAVQTSDTVSTSKLRLFYDVKPGDDLTAYLAQNPKEPAEKSQSCHGEGTDCVYQFGTYNIYTFLHDNINEVWEIELTAPGIALETGIEVGMKKSDVSAKYGESADGFYEVGKCVLQFIYDGDTITGISYMQQE